MDRISEIDALINQFNLNLHPFYQDWRMGTLPKEALVAYSTEYGQFIATIADGWETVGQPGYAQEEREHEVMWQTFRRELGATGTPSVPHVEVLVKAAKNLFAAGVPEALGALYAFEAQQPNTSRSKLDGLNEHYNMSDTAKEYFVVHADDIHEAEDIRKDLLKLSDADFARAKNACAIVCSSMLGALDGIYYARTPVNA